jgi:hypothetical protein
MKKCTKCNIKKSFTDFNKNKAGKYGLEPKCKQCVSEYYMNNKEQHIKNTKQYYQDNKEQWKSYPSQCGIISWGEKNPEKYKQYQNQYQKNMREDNPLFKVKGNLRSRISAIIKNKGITKSKGLLEVLGTDSNSLKKHIEDKWSEGMSWENYGNKKGQWSIDHIIPLDSAKDEKDIIVLNHYTNLQPLWWKDNIIKRNKIIFITDYVSRL